MVTAHTKVEIVFGNPEVRQDDVLVILIGRWKNKHQCRDIRGGGQVQTTIADTAFQIVLIDSELAFIPKVHRHPTDSLLDPLVQTELPECVLLAGILLCRLTGITNLVDANRDTQGWIGFLPGGGVRPIVRFICTVDNGIEGVVDFSALYDVLCFLVDLIADGFRIVARRGNKKIQRLHTGIAGTLGHNIKQLAVRLRVQLIENNAVGVETVLVANVSGKHLVDAARGLIDDPLLGVQNFDALGKCRTHTNHVSSHIENDGCLLSVGSAAIDLGTFLTVTAGQKQSHGSGKFGLALFLGDFDICGIKLAVAVGLERSEYITDDLLLPVNQFKGLSRPSAFGMAKALNKGDRIVSGILIVVGAFGHKTGRLILFQLSDMRSPPQKGYKK